ncbi:MAG: LamG domain-containing protein [Sedimentisphaerales bacterium]
MMKRLVVIVVVALMAAPSFGQLAGYWNFDEGSGTTVADSSGKSNPGVLQTNGSDLPVWITGHDGTGKALRFNATTTSSANSNYVFVDINTNDAVAHLGGAFTISMWVRSDQIEDWVLRVPTYNWRWLIYTNAYDFELAQDPNATNIAIHSDYFSSDTNTAWYQIPFPGGWEDWGQNYTGLWYHLAVTYDGNYLKKYVNGYLVYAVGAPTSPLPTATSKLYIAAMGLPNEPNGSGYFSGDLDDVAIWAGSYLPASEIVKLANGDATPLTVADHAPEPPLPPVNYTLESDMSWNQGGWRAFYSPAFQWDISLSSNTAKTVWMASAWWWSGSVCTPGGRTSVWDWSKWYPEILDDNTIYVPDTYPDMNVATHGMEWVSSSWSGRAPTIAVFAAYITPGIAICQNNWGFQPYDPSPTRAIGWEDKPYWKAYARVAGVHAQGCSFRIRVYTYPTPNATSTSNSGVFVPLTDPNVLTLIDDLELPLSGVDYQWQEFKFLLPKAPTIGGSTGGNWYKTHHWFEASIVGGDANTVLYIDEFSPISDQYATYIYDLNNKIIGTTGYLDGDLNKDSFVDYKDLELLADEWVESNNLDPRSGGLLTNGDFSADAAAVGTADDANKVMTPTGWSFSGTGNYGLWRTAKRGGLNYANWTEAGTIVPIGGDISAFMTDMSSGDPNGVLSQTASATAVSGQTYYAMGYVMTWYPGDNGPWYGWKDTATMTISIDNVVKATFTRRLSMNKWRALYGTYTAVSADAGKPIKISFSYDNTYVDYYSQAGNMYVGYAYLGTTVPNEWPEKRQNLLTNGGFEDLSVIQSAIPSLYTSLTTSDNAGAWFVTGTPAAIPGWVYEVPSPYDMNNKGGIWASAFYGPPIPTPGLNDVAVYVNNDFVLGQVVGALNSGTTYYLDAACGLSSGTYLLDVTDGNGANWPNPAPKIRVELWRIPAGVTNGTDIYNAISGGNLSYVKVAEANVPATGDILGSYSGRGTPSSNWQIIGTSYTATSSDTSMYVRIRGTGGASYRPEYAFSDVYLSTQKRQIPGGSQSANISSGVQYDVLGPYNTYHAALMDLYAADADGSGIVNFNDFAIMADDWLKLAFTDITGYIPPQ